MDRKAMPIGVFDSGLGGISVLRELHTLLPEEHYLYVGDSAYAPYGIKTKEEITKRCFEIVEWLIKQGVKAIVIACNTATSACVKELRAAYPDLIIIGMEPALKLAARQYERILVLATDFTLKEKKFENLMKQFEHHHLIYKQPCPKLVQIVETDQIHNEEVVDQALHTYLDDYIGKVDSIVLGCTHFVFYKRSIERMAKGITLIDGNQGTCRHLEELLVQQGIRCDKRQFGTVEFYNSTKEDAYLNLSQKLFELENN